MWGMDLTMLPKSDEGHNYLVVAVDYLTIVNITEDGYPIVAQWNYRILCHPAKDDLLSLQELKPVDDLHSRLHTEKTLDAWEETRKARFRMDERDDDHASHRGQTLLDKLMAQIPGKDNYQADIPDTNLGTAKFHIHDTTKPLNGGFYHRWIFVQNSDAMGVRVNRRGYADRNIFVAQNTQPRVVPLDLTQCDRAGNNCIHSHARVSLAIPLEIVWLTPLNSWNPYKLEFKGDHRSDYGQTVWSGGRNGGLTADKAFNGTNTKIYILTPVQSFKGGEFEVDPADTTPGGVGVLDPWGNVRRVTASGMRIFLPEILDVGNVRTRYPIFPVLAQGSTVYKEVEALSKVVMDLTSNARYLHSVPQFGSNETEGDVTPNEDLVWFKMQTAPAVSSNPARGSHIHYVDIRSKHAVYAMDGCETYQVRTSLSKHHTHLMTVHYNSTSKQFQYLDCDGRSLCRDNHGIELTPIKV
ncbi:hypothetical protein ACOMHN_057225 [Nucella lapillus]